VTPAALALAIAALFTPPLCINAQPIQTSAPAPCTGILWGVEETKAALKCQRAILPQCITDARLDRERLDAQLDAMRVRALAAEAAIDHAPKPLPSWVLPAFASASFIVGGVLGVWLAPHI